MFNLNRLVLWSLTGALLGIGFVRIDYWWLVFFGTGLFLYLFVLTSSGREVFWGSWLAWSVKAAICISWFWYVYPLTWLNLQPGVGQKILVGVGWLSASLALSLGSAGTFYLFKKLVNYRGKWFGLYPLVWVAAEVLGSITFSLYSWAPGIVPNAHFSFGYTGYLLANSRGFDGFIYWGGVYALSFILAFAAVCVLQVFGSKKLMPDYLLVTLMLLVLLVGIGGKKQTNLSVPSIDKTVYALNTQFTSDSLDSYNGQKAKQQNVVAAVTYALAQKPDYLLLPEDSRLTTSLGSMGETLMFLSNLSKQTTVVDSARVTSLEGVTVLRAFLYDLPANKVNIVDKQYLVPQGEFMPTLNGLIIKAFVSQDLMEKLKSRLSYTVGQHDSYDDMSVYLPSVLFCSESVSAYRPYLLAHKHQAPFITHITSHAWFRYPVTLEQQLDTMLRVHSIWSREPIVVSANMSEGYLYLPNGERQAGEVVKQEKLWSVIKYRI